MLNGNPFLLGYRYGFLGIVNVALILGHPVHAKDDVKSILPQDNKDDIKFLALDMEWCIFTRKFGLG